MTDLLALGTLHYFFFNSVVTYYMSLGAMCTSYFLLSFIYPHPPYFPDFPYYESN